MLLNPFAQPARPETPREKMLKRLRDGIPPELVARAMGETVDSWANDREVQMALAEGEIRLFEQARDSGVTGAIRAAMRYEMRTWQQNAEGTDGKTLEDILKE